MNAPSAVQSSVSKSVFSDFCNAIVAILTGKNLVQCSGPPPNFDVKAFSISTVFLNADEGSVALIFK